MNFWPADIAGGIADVCSALGLIVTCVLTAGAWQVRKQLFIYPQHTAKLNDHCLQLSRYLDDFDGSRNVIADEVGKTKGDLNSLRPYLKGTRRRSLHQVQQNLVEYERALTETSLRAFLTSLYLSTSMAGRRRAERTPSRRLEPGVIISAMHSAFRLRKPRT